MAAIHTIAKELADEIRDGIAWVIVWKTSRSWNAQAVWLNSDDTFEPEDLELAREILGKDPRAVMVNGYYCGHFGENMTVAELAAGIRWHYENGFNMLDGSTAFPQEPMERPADLPADIPWYGKTTSAELDPYIYDGYMSPEDFELMHKHMEADRQQQEKDTRAAPGDLYIDGQRVDGKISELELRHFAKLVAGAAKAILNVLQQAVQHFFEEIFNAAMEVLTKLKRVVNAAVRCIARGVDMCIDAMLYDANDHPKWWHYYKHTKKKRVQKKYRRRLERQLCDKLLAAASG